MEELSLDEVIPALEAQTAAGATYGDFQYMTDETSADFMARGIMSVYLPEGDCSGTREGQLGLSQEEWSRLYVLAHTDKARAYHEYAAHYRQTDGQRYWSDDLQFSPYLPEAGEALYRQLGWQTFASLMITELYVPRERFADFMAEAKAAVLETEPTWSMARCGSLRPKRRRCCGGRKTAMPAPSSTCWWNTLPRG